MAKQCSCPRCKVRNQNSPKCEERESPGLKSQAPVPQRDGVKLGGTKLETYNSASSALPSLGNEEYGKEPCENCGRSLKGHMPNQYHPKGVCFLCYGGEYTPPTKKETAVKPENACKRYAIKKLKEALEFQGSGICDEAVIDMIKELEKETKPEKPKRRD